MDASARPALAQTLELEIAVQEYCVAEARERAREAQAQDPESIDSASEPRGGTSEPEGATEVLAG
jgi:hypothetical protein